MSGSTWLLAAGCIALACTGSPDAPPGDGPLPLAVEVELGSPATVRALYRGAPPDGLTYRLVVVREGTAGRSESSQSGPVGTSDTLAVSRVNVSSGDRLDVRLTLSSGDAVVDSAMWSQTIRP